MDTGGVEISTLETASGMAAVASVLQRVWATETPVVNVELLRAAAHAGGYVAAASLDGELVGASFAFPAVHHSELALHSHVTGVLPGVQHRGVGRAIKLHQRTWAAERGIGWIVWTFDPLVSRNAWFNIEVLGASVTQYLVDFYGPLTDAFNTHDETDRVLVVWPTTADRAARSTPALHRERSLLVSVPDDIVELRRRDPQAAAEWRQRLRNELGAALAGGGTITGFRRRVGYEVDLPTTTRDQI
jgi:predicted GNAT superfamily acetyltransferase